MIALRVHTFVGSQVGCTTRLRYPRKQFMVPALLTQLLQSTEYHDQSLSPGTAALAIRP